MNQNQLIATRKLVIAKLAKTDLFWFEVPLAGSAKISVCSPVNKDGYFIPVTAKETWAFASAWEVFPLTRAVCDQAHNFCLNNKMAFSRVPMDPNKEILNYEKYSEKIKDTYGANYKSNLVSGAHKLWVISSMASKYKPKAINYGFYYQGKPQYGAAGKHLQSGYAVIQALGSRHDGNHWDYSQMLQLMTNFIVDGQATDLRQALLDGHPALWDESKKIAAADLP